MNNKLTNKFEKENNFGLPLRILDYPHWVDQSEAVPHTIRHFFCISFCFRSLNERLGDDSLSRWEPPMSLWVDNYLDTLFWPNQTYNIPISPSYLPSGGAPRKGAQLSRQLVVTDQSDAVFFKLPSAKRKRNKVVHDLMTTVKAVKGATKKH